MLSTQTSSESKPTEPAANVVSHQTISKNAYRSDKGIKDYFKTENGSDSSLFIYFFALIKLKVFPEESNFLHRN